MPTHMYSSPFSKLEKMLRERKRKRESDMEM